MKTSCHLSRTAIVGILTLAIANDVSALEPRELLENAPLTAELTSTTPDEPLTSTTRVTFDEPVAHFYGTYPLEFDADLATIGFIDDSGGFVSLDGSVARSKDRKVACHSVAFFYKNTSSQVQTVLVEGKNDCHDFSYILHVAKGSDGEYVTLNKLGLGIYGQWKAATFDNVKPGHELVFRCLGLVEKPGECCTYTFHVK